MRIVFYPPIETAEDFGELLAKTAWYLPEFVDGTVVFPLEDAAMSPCAPPEYMGVDPTPSFSIEKMQVGDNNDTMSMLNRADCILLWDDELNIMERYNMAGVTCRILNVSKSSEKMRHEAYHNAILRGELMSAAEREAMLEECHERLKAVAPGLKKGKSYVFGTGPSLADAEKYDYDDGNTIICNTIIRNKHLLEKLQPTAIVAADPALHFGVSRYATLFRQDLVEAMETYDSLLFIPMGYYPLFIMQYPQFKDRTFGVPVVPATIDNISIDLSENYQIACYANILTMFLLPLGATLGEDIHVFGCDGRKPEGVPEDNASPFWEHHKDSEYEDAYHTLQEAHPGFFKLNLQEWYDDHCENVAKLVRKIENEGGRIVTRSRSFIPVLTRRLVPELRDVYLPMLEEAAVNATPVSPYSYVRDNRMRDRYKVSVFVSLYNAERFMAAIMGNLTSQTLYQLGLMEIVLIDSGSPSNERAVASRYMDQFEHILYARTYERETVYAAFNRGINEARGQYVMNLDADNRLRNDAVELFADYLDTHPDVGLVYGNQFISQIENEEFHNHVRFGYCRRAAYAPSMVLHGFYFGSEMMWRKELHEKVGMYREDLIVAGDYDMVCKLAEATKFAHVDEYFGMYTKNLSGVEFSNLELCAEESRAVCDEFEGCLPPPKDPPRVHVHYPLREAASEEYVGIVCHTMSFDKSIAPAVNKLLEHLTFPHIIYSVDQNSSPVTQASIAHFVGKGMVVSGENLLPDAQKLFDFPMAYSPAIRFCVVAYGRVAVLEKNFMSMSRPALTGYIRAVYEELTADMRDENGRIDPVKIPMLCDHHEIARLNLAPHFSFEGEVPELEKSDMTVFIQHYCPKGQEDVFRESLRRCIKSIREQQYGGRCQIIVSDDGSSWSKELGDGVGNGIRAYVKAELSAFDCMADMDVDCYLYKNRTGYFSKGVLWNAARKLATADKFVFLDDDHFFRNGDALTMYADSLDEWKLVVGRTRSYRFMDVDGVFHVQHMGFESPVVQGSNFGVRRDVLESVGGFDDRTFIWGTGDDPVLFWKLYEHLRPADYQREMQACYVDAIETENPYSGRWQSDCRVNRELFTREFLRLYRTHPNNNASRNRKAWMQHIPSEAVQEKPLSLATTDGLGCTVMVPHQGDVWATRKTVVSIIEQRIAEPVEILVIHNAGQAKELGVLPPGVALLECEVERLSTQVQAGLDASSYDVVALYMPGVVMAQKTLKSVLQLFHKEDANFVIGARVFTDEVGVEKSRTYPALPTLENGVIFMGEWIEDHPFFFRKGVVPATQESKWWAMRFVFALVMNGKGFTRTNIFSYHEDEARFSPAEGLAILDTVFPEEQAELLQGAIGAQQIPQRVDHAATQQNLVEWYRSFLERQRDQRALYTALTADEVDGVALCGEERDMALLQTVWFNHIPIASILSGSDADNLNGAGGVVLCTAAREESDFNSLKKQGVDKVYAMRRRFGHGR